MEFSGLERADVLIGEEPAAKLWYVVTPITDDQDEMCRNTASFVDVCAMLRGMSREELAQANADLAAMNEGIGGQESGGSSSYMVTGGERIMRRRHGEVWKALQLFLEDAGFKLQKARSAWGYETDGVVKSKKRTTLIEIKTGNSAADIYTGLGQLQIYPKLMPSLSECQKILLLPAKPPERMMIALTESGVACHFYEVCDNNDWSKVNFSKPFLKAFGAAK